MVQALNRLGRPHPTTRHNHTTCGSPRAPLTMIARPPPSYEWTLHPGITDYGAVCALFGISYTAPVLFSTPRGVLHPNTALILESPFNPRLCFEPAGATPNEVHNTRRLNNPSVRPPPSSNKTLHPGTNRLWSHT